MKNVKEIVILRATVLSAIRVFFDSQGFLEVDTPLMVAAPDTEPTIEPFQTTWHESGQSHQAYLIPSPEFLIKRLLAEKVGNLYQLGKSFRNYEPSQAQHNPEFQLLEWYRANADYTDIMTDCENLLHFTISRLGKQVVDFSYQGKKVDVAKPWERLSVSEAFQKYAQIDQETLLDETTLVAAAAKKGYSTVDASYDDLFYQILLNEIEPHLGITKPTFLYDYPLSQAALARKKQKDPRLAERFELYIAGLELANAFSELTNWQEQEKRLQAQLKTRQKNGQPTWDYDRDLIEALKKDLSPTGGIALGVDRLIMLLADAAEITTVLPFSAAKLFNLEKVI